MFTLTQLTQFRNDMYEWFPHRPDALMDLLDAISSNTNARSVVELSLNPLFRREYSSVHDGIENLFVPSDVEYRLQERQDLEQELIRMLAPYLPLPQRPFWLLVTDVTSSPRPFARTLSDRTFVYQPNSVKGVKPITIGHQYSVLAVLPEKANPHDPPWVVPLLVNRVTSTETKREAGLAQINRLIEDKTLPFHSDLCVHAVDSDYSAVTYLGGVAKHSNLVTIARMPGNRNVYQQATPSDAPNSKGHPTWFGKPMSLKDPSTFDAPDEVAQSTFTTRKGKTYTVQLEGWHNLLVRGRRRIPMHKHPFTLVRGRVLDDQGRMVFSRPLWLVVFGERRAELSLLAIWDAYQQRYDIEHFFRFGKQRLLMGAYQSPETSHDENWWTLVQLAYLHLWIAQGEAISIPRPWERYLPSFQMEDSTSSVMPPSAVQRDLGRIIGQIGTPAGIPKRRGKSPGRSLGQSLGKRVRLPVIKKKTQPPQKGQQSP